MTAAIPRPRAARQPAGGEPAGPEPRLAVFVPHASDLFTDHHAHGDGLVAFEVAVRLARRGHEVHVAAPRVEVRGPLPPTLHLYELRVPGGTSALGRLLFMIRVRRLYDRLGHGRRIDVVHQLNPVFTGISLALAGTRAPVVLGSFVSDWPQGIDPRVATGGPSPARRLKRFVASLQQRCAAALLVTTPAAESRIVELDRDRAKVVRLPHGIDPALYVRAADAPAAAAGAAPSILFLGGVEYRKGVFTLLEAFRRVHAAVPGCRLVVAGTGWEWSRLAALVAELPEGRAVELLGRVGREDVARLMHAATVFCLPSFGEPFGMALLEAMACGKPVVATDAGGAGHLVDDAGGRKVASGEPGPLADALIEIVRSPALQASMGAHNRAAVERVYDWETVIGRLEAVYRSVLRPARSR